MKVDPATRHIAVTMAVSFALAVGFMVWQRHGASSTPSVSLPDAPARAAAGDPSVSFAGTTPGRADLAMSRSTPAPPAAATAGDDAPPPVPERNVEGPPLPVVFAIRFRDDTLVDPDGDQPPTRKRVTEGTLFNDSDKNLDITVIETNLPTMTVSRLQFNLHHGMQKVFGGKEGLPMTAGDEITLRSPAYHDLTQIVP